MLMPLLLSLSVLVAAPAEAQSCWRVTGYTGTGAHADYALVVPEPCSAAPIGYAWGISQGSQGEYFLVSLSDPHVTSYPGGGWTFSPPLVFRQYDSNGFAQFQLLYTFSTNIPLQVDPWAPQGSCVFYAPDSVYYGTASGGGVYSYGSFSFVWEPSTGRILGGYYPARVIIRTPVVTYFNNVVSGSITPGSVIFDLDLLVSMRLSRSIPNSAGFELTGATLTGTTNSAKLSGMLDGPFLFEATGTVSCN